ncbi:MAG TPA: hypothetical protein VFI29_08460 [Hanamia sp.]|nr:hypothetical protein [Hanamia sp.]
MKTKQLVSLRLSSANTSRGVLLKQNSKVIDGSINITVSVDTQGYAAFSYYANNKNGNRSYKIVSNDPGKDSSKIMCKAFDKTKRIRIDNWSVTFYRPADYQLLTNSLRETGLLNQENIFEIKERFVNRIYVQFSSLGKLKQIALKKETKKVEGNLGLALQRYQHLSKNVKLPFGLLTYSFRYKEKPTASRWIEVRKRVNANPVVGSDEISIRADAGKLALHLDEWTVLFRDKETFTSLIHSLSGFGFLNEKLRFNMQARVAKSTKKS